MEISLDEGIGSEDNSVSFNLKDNSKRAAWTIWTIGLVGISAVTSFLASALYIKNIYSETYNTSPNLEDWLEYADYFSSFAWLAAGISFLHWFRRAYSNIQGLGLHTKHTDGWAVGYFFIPIVAWVKPYTIMDEIIRAHWLTLPSISETVDYDSRKSTMNVWWILFLMTGSFEGVIQIGINYLVTTNLPWLHLITLAIPRLIEIAAVLAAVYLVQNISNEEKLLYQHSSKASPFIH